MRRLTALFEGRASRSGTGRAFRGVLKRVLKAIGDEVRHRRDARLLQSMTEYELHDIGLIRSQIDDVVRVGRRGGV